MWCSLSPSLPSSPQLPQTSEVLCAVPNCISALCLNEVIRRTIVGTQPFDRLLKTLISPEYHLTMKKHNRGDRSTVPNTIGVCVDQLLRHQTELRGCFMDALMRVREGAWRGSGEVGVWWMVEGWEWRRHRGSMEDGGVVEG